MNDAPLILVVDDDPASRTLIADLLASEPLEIAFATSAHEAMESIRVAAPDVLVSDFLVPGMGELDLVRWLRARSETERTPILIVSSLDSKEHLARALDEGATDFIAKPLHAMELRARVRSMLRIAQACGVMKQTMSLRTDLAHMIVHDLRTPLQALMLQVQMFRSARCEDAPPVDDLRYQVGRLKGLVDELLITAKSEAGRLVPSRQRIAATALIEAAVNDVRPYVEAYGTRIDAQVAPAVLHVDVALMQRCLVNLLVNALKYAPRGTTIDVVVQSFGDRAEIAVHDEGDGIPDHLREIIFDRFAVAEGRRSDQVTVGLGLSFCKLAVDAHEGSIEHANRSPRGSTFRIVLPLATY